MADMTVDALLTTIVADMEGADLPVAIALLRLIANALRSPADVAAALDRVAVRLEGDGNA